jgi:hypothetical protein
MIIDGMRIIAASILQSQRMRDGDTPMEVQVATSRLINCNKYLTFLWRQLRGKRIRGEYKNIQFSTGTSAGRTVVQILWKPSETENYGVSYVGVSDGYSTGVSDCEIEHSRVQQFKTELQEFTENFDSIEIHVNT